MPAMLRPAKGKATKIAYKILGKPDNMGNKRIPKSKTEQSITKEETYRIRSY